MSVARQMTEKMMKLYGPRPLWRTENEVVSGLGRGNQTLMACGTGSTISYGSNYSPKGMGPFGHHARFEPGRKSNHIT